MELGCALMKNLIKLFDEALPQSESPTPNRLPRYDPLQISFLKRDSGNSKKKTNQNL